MIFADAQYTLDCDNKIDYLKLAECDGFPAIKSDSSNNLKVYTTGEDSDLYILKSSGGNLEFNRTDKDGFFCIDLGGGYYKVRYDYPAHLTVEPIENGNRKTNSNSITTEFAENSYAKYTNSKKTNIIICLPAKTKCIFWDRNNCKKNIKLHKTTVTDNIIEVSTSTFNCDGELVNHTETDEYYQISTDLFNSYYIYLKNN